MITNLLTQARTLQAKALIGLSFAATLGFVGCTTQNQATAPNQLQPTTVPQEVANPLVPTAPGIQIDGSSTVYPISDAIAKAFKQTQGDKAGQIDVKFSGTTGGFRVNATSSQQKPELQAFVLFYLQNAKKLVETVNFIALPDEGYSLSEMHFYRGKVGTVFGGVPQPDLTIGELLRKQAVF
jgi:ABC-type phosphate transport system substrate-binding protein